MCPSTEVFFALMYGEVLVFKERVTVGRGEGRFRPPHRNKGIMKRVTSRTRHSLEEVKPRQQWTVTHTGV